MRYFHYVTDNSIFYKEPEKFSLNSDKELLSHALGAALYVPAARKDLMKDILSTDACTVVLCLEDSVPNNLVQEAEDNVVNFLKQIEAETIKNNNFSDSLPLIFIRVRDENQLKRLIEKSSLKELCGFVLPKFNIEEGKSCLQLIEEYNKLNNRTLYVMPIMETPKIIHKETRIKELLDVKCLLDEYKSLILNVRVGGTDLSGLYSLRRSKEFTIYDITVVRDCISDIINVFKRDGYVISAPVNEYYGEGSVIVKETLLDKANGLVGKTVIHPKQIRTINALMVVSKEEYMDAEAILKSESDGVIRSGYSNKMNEVKTHYKWAKEIKILSRIMGVLNDGRDYKDLF